LQVTHLALRNFRNFAEATVTPHPRFNVITGHNGQGKTNLLESLFWLGTLRPHRATRLRELVQWGQKEAYVEGRILDQGLEHRLAVELKGSTRQALREGKNSRAAAYFGALSVVLFVPEDVGLVRGSPESRRRFLDRAIFTGRTPYLASVLDYRRALDGRNRLLRDNAPDPLIEAFEETLAIHAVKVIEARTDYVSSIAPQFSGIYQSIVGEDSAGSLRYRPSIVTAEKNGVDGLREVWAMDRERDRQRGYTQRGPHTDDMSFGLGDRSAKTYASQGQQRAMVLALKIAEIGLLQKKFGRTPVLLLDDVSSELDPQRNARLFDFLDRFEGQVFITTTDPSFLRIDTDKRTWQVSDGQVTVQEN